MSKAYSEGLNFSFPVKGDTSYDATVDAAFTTISGHGHLGDGSGDQIVTAAVVANAITGAKIRLANNEALRALNAAGAADVDLLKLTTGNLLSLLAPLVFGSNITETATGATAISLATFLTVLNKASGSATLANGTTEGQAKLIYNINSASCVVTPATSAGVNTATLAQNGAVLYLWLSSEWRACAFGNCTLA